MKRIRIPIIMFLIGICFNAAAGMEADFVLTDGSVIHGRLESFADGRYTVRSKSLGTVTINQSKVKLIRMGDHTGSSENHAVKSPEASGAELQGMVNRMQGDKEIMALIEALKDDPEMQAVMNDPKVLQAISSGDLSALLSNPKFMELMNDPKVREIQKKMGQ